MSDRDRTLYEERPMPPEPWTHEDNPDWVYVESYPEPYMLVPVVPCEHGNVNPHEGIESFTASDGLPGMRYFECDGKPEAADES